MSKESDPVPEFETAPDTPAPRARRRWKLPGILLGIFVLIPAVIFALWSWVAMSYTYSSGERAGYVQKFSDKGWLCKTWEGELSMVNIPGAAQERWNFSVRDDSVAALVRASMGSKIALSYEEHRGIPTSCFGETAYFVKAVRQIPAP